MFPAAMISVAPARAGKLERIVAAVAGRSVSLWGAGDEGVV
jgi:hypothetical protein